MWGLLASVASAVPLTPPAGLGYHLVITAAALGPAGVGTRRSSERDSAYPSSRIRGTLDETSSGATGDSQLLSLLADAITVCIEVIGVRASDPDGSRDVARPITATGQAGWYLLARAAAQILPTPALRARAPWVRGGTV